jgi:hypothetical protein
MASEWILGRLAGGVEWIHLAQNKERTGGGSSEYGDEPSGSGATELVRLYAFLRSHTCSISNRPHHRPYEHLNNNIFGEEYAYKLWRSSVWSFLQFPVISCLLGPDILICTLFKRHQSVL